MCAYFALDFIIIEVISTGEINVEKMLLRIFLLKKYFA